MENYRQNLFPSRGLHSALPNEERHFSRVQSRRWCGGECAQSSITWYKHSDEERHLSRQAVTNELRQQLSSWIYAEQKYATQERWMGHTHHHTAEIVVGDHDHVQMMVLHRLDSNCFGFSSAQRSKVKSERTIFLYFRLLDDTADV